MTKEEAIKWLYNLNINIGEMRHQDLWGYAQAITEIGQMIADMPDTTSSIYDKAISNKHKIMSECGISEDVFNLFVIFLMTYGFENGDISEEMLNLLPKNVRKALDILKE